MTQRNPIALGQGADNARIAALHDLCRQDFAKGEAERASVSAPADSVRAFTAQYNELDVAISVAQQLLDSGSTVSLREGLRLLLRALDAEPDTTPAALRYSRRAIEADGTVHAARYTGRRTFTTACAIYPAPVAERLDASSALPVTCPGCRTATADEPPALRCPAAHPEDPTPCGGPIVVTILDARNAGADGCELHGARLLASLEGGRVYPLPDAPDQAAIRVFRSAGTLRPFAWREGGQ
ncbi:hypothetical protein SUDANB145_07167 (plasmid) [Streptomyces sp. enrichment culture]|uniref:hypothetical protein n=1 Tax=Streptomyces sp. enrichment culture TaxID=1795815 RepID=UPI003F54828A